MPGSIIATEIFGIMMAGTTAFQMTAFAINIVASAIISKAFSPTIDNPGLNSSTANPGSRVQAGPAGDNKIPVVYGAAWIGGVVVDMSITADNQQLYYVLALSEVTNTETGGTPDTITFGDVYFGGKKCVFDPTDQYKVTGLLDESTGITDVTVASKLEIYLYRNGSSSGANTTQTAIQVMQATGLTYTWDATKLMTNCAFAIVHMTYSQNANLTGLQATKFKLTNSRYKPGDCFNDYLTSSRYGAAIPTTGVDTASLTALNLYCDESFSYTTYDSGTTTQTRFRFDGTLDTNQTIMNNMQLMASCCDCLIKYNEITGLWGVIVQKPTYLAVFNLTDSNMISSIQVTPTDLASSYNIAEVKFPDSTNQDAFNTATFNLAVINPTLLYPNEPVNKQSINLSLVNNNVRAQYLANRFLEAAREDLQIKVSITYVGLQLEAGDIVTVTSVNYGWAAKLFRISQVVENFGDDGVISASLTLMEYNPAVYDDINITQFTPAPNTGIGSPLGFGALTVPTIVNLQPTTANPSFGVVVTAAASGITQYAEVYYSISANPSSDAQRIFAGTTAVNPSGSPYTPTKVMGTVTLSNIPNGDWYFAVRMVNSLGKSVFSGSSDVLRWRPTTFQYSERYAVVAYGDDLSGTGLSASASGKSYYGIFNSATSNFSTAPADYTWYAASPTFGTANSLLYTSRQGRKFSFATGPADFVAKTGRFVPTNTGTYDPSIWSGLPAGTNAIDLDVRTGQLTETATSGGIGPGELAITNNLSGSLSAKLAPVVDLGAGLQQITVSPSFITIDVYGRVLGFVTPDGFYYTRYDAVATSGQTVFTPTARQANYIVGMDLVFQNGALLDTTEYTESSTTVTLGTGATTGDCITILSMRAVNQGITFTLLNATVTNVTSATVTYSASTLPYQNIVAGDVHTFLNTGTPATYIVSSYNAATRQITYTTTVSGVSAGQSIYLYKTAGQSYRPFSRWTTTLAAASSFTPTTFGFENGYEKLFINGMSVNDQDYDLVENSLSYFPATATGLLTIIQFVDNNLTVTAGSQTSTAINTVSGQSTYTYNLDQNAFELYNNGVLQILTSDYTTASGAYTLGTAPTTNLNILQQTTYNRTGAA